MKLGEIALLKTGLVLVRKRANTKFEEAKKAYRVITLKNISESGFFCNDQFELFESTDALDERYLTEMGDILIRMSTPHTAVCIDRSEVGLVVPSSLAIIQIKSEDFLPEYVSWYLNSSYAKRELRRYQTGTAMATTNIAVLSEIDVKWIPLGDQKLVGKIHELHFQEGRLLTRLIEEKERYHRVITAELVNRRGAAKSDYDYDSSQD